MFRTFLDNNPVRFAASLVRRKHSTLNLTASFEPYTTFRISVRRVCQNIWNLKMPQNFLPKIQFFYHHNCNNSADTFEASSRAFYYIRLLKPIPHNPENFEYPNFSNKNFKKTHISSIRTIHLCRSFTCQQLGNRDAVYVIRFDAILVKMNSSFGSMGRIPCLNNRVRDVSAA